MFRDVAFGQYYPANSFVHKMDARVKIVLSVAYLVAVIMIESFFGFGIFFVFLAAAIGFSKVPLRSILKSMRPILFLLTFTALINLFFVHEGRVLAEWWIFKFTEGGLLFTGRMALRLLFLVMGASLLTLTTTPVDLTAAIESLLAPLKLIRFPVRELALIMSITLSFIPSLMEETDRIIRAQKARGADFESGGLIKRARAFIPILIPLLIGAFRRADELAFAMESRCYGASRKRTKLKVMRLTLRDLFGVLITGCFFAAMLGVKYAPGIFGGYAWMYF